MDKKWLNDIGLTSIDAVDFIALIGPTGVGKTECALRLARAYPNRFEIVSCDSVQVYRGLDIGSAKVSQAIQSEIPHHLIDICDLQDRYSAQQFAVDAKNAVAKIREQGKCAIVVGGTFLYLQAFLQGLSPIEPIRPAAEIVVKELMDLGLEKAWSFLQHIDPETASKVAPHDRCRIERALLVYFSTHQTMTYWRAQPRQKLHDYRSKVIAILPESRERLRQQLADRFDAMLSQGLIEELSSQINGYPGFSEDFASMRSIGYRQVLLFLKNKLTYEQMRLDAITATRRYFKRQLTWLRSMTDIDVSYQGAAEWLSALA